MATARSGQDTSQLVSGARNVIRRFTLRRALMTAIIFGLIAAVESAAQGVSMVAAFPNATARAKVIEGLASNPALGLFYGDRHADIISPAGYMVYRILPIVVLILAIWSLTFITQMLRGQEETGRWEVLLTGTRSARGATLDTLLGAGGGILIVYAITVLILTLAGRSPLAPMAFTGCLFYSLAAVSGAAVALGIGALTSQLAATRRRALLYGIGIIIVCFGLRAVGNVVDGLAWLKNVTPFGWIDKMHPFTAPQPLWLIPLALLALGCCSWAIWLAGRRDMGASYIADVDSAKPRLLLLGSQLGFAYRQNRSVLFGWLVASLAFAALVASIDKTVAQSLAGAGKLSKAISTIAGNPYAHLELAYLGAAGYLILILLLVVATTGISAMRAEEASGRLDNLVSGTVDRTRWLATRVLLLAGASIVISLAANFVVWLLANAQGIHVSFTTLVFGGLSILGPVAFLLGAGVLAYGLLPRVAAALMYLLIAWSFTVDILASALKLNKYVADTSLLHHIALVPAANPEWRAFAIMTGLGLAMAVGGALAFQRRDMVAE